MGKKLNLKKGEIIIMPANKPHAVKAISTIEKLRVTLDHFLRYLAKHHRFEDFEDKNREV